MARGKDGAEPQGAWIDGAYVLPARAGAAGVWKAFRYRLYPNPDQEAYFNRLFGCCRYVYNHYLEVRMRAWEERQENPDVRIPTRFDMCRDLTRLKREAVGSDDEPFLRKVDATALTYEVSHLDAAFAGLFRRAARAKAEGAPVRGGFPRFKSRRSKRRATVAFPNPDYLGERAIRFAKVGWVKANVHRPLEGEPVCLTVSQDSAGRWWASIKCKDAPAPALPESGECVGLSIGSSPLIVTSDGEVLDLPGCDPQSEKRLAREKRRLAKCQGPERNRRPSARYERQRLRTAKLYAEEADRLADALNNLTSRIARDYGTIVVRDSGHHELRRQLRYKCEWAGRAYVELPRLDGDAEAPGGATASKAPTLEERAKQAERDLKLGLSLLERASREGLAGRDVSGAGAPGREAPGESASAEGASSEEAPGEGAQRPKKGNGRNGGEGGR